MRSSTDNAARIESQVEQNAEKFAESLLGLYNHAAVTLMISIGHKLGLFDVMARLPAAHSSCIAAEAGLAERYVREWLAALVTGAILEFDAVNQTYYLPRSHAACLTRAASPNNLATLAQHIPGLCAVEEQMVGCFRTGTGLSYSDYPCFHQVMAEDSEQTVVEALFDWILPLIPDLKQRLIEGIDVMDAGCGAGLALMKLAKAFPASRFVGYDLCADAFTGTVDQARQLGLDNLRFEARDLRGFDEAARFDLITTFDAVHDQADPPGLLAGFSRALRPGGVYLMQDIAGSSHLENNRGHLIAPLLYTISCFHCTPVSLAQGGPGLGTLWGEELAEEMLRQAGFRHIELHRLDHDPTNVYFICRAGDPEDKISREDEQ